MILRFWFADGDVGRWIVELGEARGVMAFGRSA
jgi:hypothetical protein